LVAQIPGDVGQLRAFAFDAYQIPLQPRAVRTQLFAFFAGGLAAGGGGAFGLVFSFAGLAAGGFGDIGMT